MTLGHPYVAELASLELVLGLHGPRQDFLKNFPDASPPPTSLPRS